MSRGIEQIDIDFSFAIVPPSVTFADTMRLEYGWTTPDNVTLRRAPFLADTDGVEDHIEAMQRYAVSAYDTFRNSQGRLSFPVDSELVIDWVDENAEEFQVFTFRGEVAELACRYLRGEGDDYERFLELQKTV